MRWIFLPSATASDEMGATAGRCGTTRLMAVAVLCQVLLSLAPQQVHGSVAELAGRWREACQTRNVTAWQHLFSLEATYEDSLTGKPIRARSHGGPFAALWPQAARWECVVRQVIPLEGGGAVEWRASAKVGENDLEFTGLAVFAVEKGEFVWMRNYFDTRPFLKLLRRTAER